MHLLIDLIDHCRRNKRSFGAHCAGPLYTLRYVHHIYMGSFFYTFLGCSCPTSVTTCRVNFCTACSDTNRNLTRLDLATVRRPSQVLSTPTTVTCLSHCAMDVMQRIARVTLRFPLTCEPRIQPKLGVYILAFFVVLLNFATDSAICS